MKTRTESRGQQVKIPPTLHPLHLARLSHVTHLTHVTLLTLLTIVTLLATACTFPRPTRGGKAITTPKPNGTLTQTLLQGEDASQISKQDQDIVRVRSYTLPPGSRIEESRLQTTAAGLPVTNVQSVVVSAPMPVTEREETHARTELGAAQKNTARELSARLSSLKGVVWVGLGLFVFGVASLVWPPLKAIIGSVTTSAALTLGGVALIILPSLVVGNELLIFAGVALAIGVWFIAHRHGQLRGLIAATEKTTRSNRYQNSTTQRR